MPECVECEEVITNPICTDCLAVRMREFVGTADRKLAQEIHGFELDGETTCILCGKGMSICAHCFSRDIYDYLEEKNKSLAEEFAARFDFDLRKDLA